VEVFMDGRGESRDGGGGQLLVVDIGNTTSMFGLYRGDELVGRWRLTTRESETQDEYWVILRGLFQADGLEMDRVSGVVVASVVPSLTHSLVQMVREKLGMEPLVVDHRVDCGLKVLYETPRAIGADRLTNAAGAFALFGGPTIVVDLGTATTWDVVTAAGEYLGGAIAPGVEISAGLLFQRAARLKVVDLGKPERVIGRTTDESIRSGLIHGAAGQIDRLCDLTVRERGERHKVVATGGLAGLISPYSKRIERVEPWLTLRGMLEIYRRSRKDESPRGGA